MKLFVAGLFLLVGIACASAFNDPHQYMTLTAVRSARVVQISMYDGTDVEEVDDIIRQECTGTRSEALHCPERCDKPGEECKARCTEVYSYLRLAPVGTSAYRIGGNGLRVENAILACEDVIVCDCVF